MIFFINKYRRKKILNGWTVMWGYDLFSSMFLGGSSYLAIHSKVDMKTHRSSFAWPSPGLYLLWHVTLLRASTCTLRSDLVKMLSDIVTTVTEHIVRRLFVWELAVKVDRFLGSLIWPVTMVNKPFTQSYRIINRHSCLFCE